MNWLKLLNGFIECLLFLGTLATILCLVVFMFVATSTWIIILSGTCAANALFMYDRYRQNKFKKT